MGSLALGEIFCRYLLILFVVPITLKFLLIFWSEDVSFNDIEVFKSPPMMLFVQQAHC
jgi:hypothetical protein